MPSSLTHLQLIPAESISALYDTNAKKLLLKASGQQVDITRSISFHRLEFEGGLLFELHGWVGPVTQGHSAYSIQNSFKIELPSKVFPSNTVVVKTENRTAWIVPIKPLLKDDVEDTQTDAKSDDSAVDLPEVKDVAGDEEISTGLRQSFTIKQSTSFKGQGGSLDVVFNDNYVFMTNAAIRDDNLEWTFTSLQTGTTEVVVYVGQTNPPFVYRIVYTVNILPPNASVTSQEAPTSDKAAESKDSSVAIPLSWDGFVNIGYNLIKDTYEAAKLYEIDAAPVNSAPVFDEWGLVNNRIVCSLPENKTALIRSIGWGEFGPVEVVDSPWLEDVDIEWPVSLTIRDAFSILREVYQGPVGAVTLRQPLYPGIDQPFYIFTTDTLYRAVGVKDRKNHDFGPTGREIQQS